MSHYSILYLWKKPPASLLIIRFWIDSLPFNMYCTKQSEMLNPHVLLFIHLPLQWVMRGWLCILHMSTTTPLQIKGKNTVATWHTGRTQTPTRSQDDRQRKMNGRLATLYLQWLGLGTGGHWETVWELRWQWTVLVDTMWVGVALGWGEGLRRVTVKLKIGWETDRDRLTICVLVAISWGKEEKQKRKERQKGGR